jgi:predicted esterase
LALAALVAVALYSPTAGSDPDPAPKIYTVQVAKDRDIEVVDGPKDSPHVILYLHGVCGNPLAFRTWRAAAAKHGTLISVRGDETCERFPARSSWSTDFVKNNRRITAAIEAASAFRQARGEAKLDAEHPVIMGYSQGSRRAEQLTAKFPDRYQRVALLAGMSKPLVANLKRADRVLIMVGSQDVKKHLMEGRDDLQKAGIDVHYQELPFAHHGEYGPQALRVMGEGLDWLFKDLP